MQELKLKLDNVTALERRLAQIDAIPGIPHWIGNWYLETTPTRVAKIMLKDDIYYYLELINRGSGFVFTRQDVLDDISPFELDRIALHNILHKSVKPWSFRNLTIDILLFEDIDPHTCITYAPENESEARAFIAIDLGISHPDFIQVPFNVIKRRQLGLPDFD